MITIIKDGVKPKKTKTIYKTTCERCGCVFEFEYEDFFAIERRPDGNATINCPCCDKIIEKRMSQYEQKEVEE